MKRPCCPVDHSWSVEMYTRERAVSIPNNDQWSVRTMLRMTAREWLLYAPGDHSDKRFLLGNVFGRVALLPGVRGFVD